MSSHRPFHRLFPRSVLLVAALTCLLLAADACQACPNCKDAVATSADGLNVARGYAISILIMLGMPLTLLGSFGIYVWREMRRLERQAGAPEAAKPKP